MASDRDLRHVLEPDRRLRLVRVVEDDGDGSAGDAGLTTLVDQVEEVGGADLRGNFVSCGRLERRFDTHRREVGDAENEADSIENVGFAGPVPARRGEERRGKRSAPLRSVMQWLDDVSPQSRDGVEARVPSRDACPHGVRLEPVEDEFRDPHRGVAGLWTVRVESMRALQVHRARHRHT